jgi:hypothetical protein
VGDRIIERFLFAVDLLEDPLRLLELTDVGDRDMYLTRTGRHRSQPARQFYNQRFFPLQPQREVDI